MSKLSTIESLIYLVLLHKIPSYKMSYLDNYIFSFWINIMSKQEVIKEKNTKNSPYNRDKIVRKNWTSNLTIQEKVEKPDEENFSVITKSTRPKVVIQSENIENECSICHNHKMIKFIFLVVISCIILITFFLSLKTYNMVNELSLNLLN